MLTHALRIATILTLGLPVSAAALAQSFEAAPKPIETPILAAQSTFPSGYTGTLSAVSDPSTPEQVSGFRYTDSRGTERNHTVDEIRTGIVLVHALGKDLLKLRSKEFDRAAGGEISLMFYREFLSGDDRREVRFTYQPEGDHWVLRTNDPAGRDLFNQLWIKIKTSFFSAPTGVAEIKLFEDGSQVRRYLPGDLPRASDRAFFFLE